MKIEIETFILILAAACIATALYLSWSSAQYYKAAAELYVARCTPVIPVNLTWP